MEKIPQQRAIFYLFVLGFLPLVGVFYNYSIRQELQETLQHELAFACTETARQNQKESCNRFIKNTFQEKDHFYLDKQLGSLKLLNEEVALLQKATLSGFHPEEDAIRRRLHFLTGNENVISFTESQEKRYSGFTETTESLHRSVEMDVQDLRKIISIIEGTTGGDGDKSIATRPHLIITDFRIDKKRGYAQEVFALQLKVLKREYQNKS